MNEKGKEWIKKNWYRIVLHTVPLFIYIIIIDAMLNIFMYSIDNDKPMEWNIFISVTVFGGLSFVTLLMLYIDKWTDRFDIYRKEYNDFIKKP